jgi:hypothetical protein
MDEKDLPNKLDTLVDRMSVHQVIKEAIDTGAFAAGMVSLNPTSQALKAINGLKVSKQLGTVTNSTSKVGKIRDVSIDSYTVHGIKEVQSDSTSTTQPPNQ